MPHVDHAGQIRKHAAAAQVKNLGDNEDEDMVSDNDQETDSVDMDSVGMEEFMGGDSADDAISHAVSQQQDFVGF